MELKEFLLLLFNKQTDQYPMIRESFMKCWDSNDVLDILALTKYHCSKTELKKYIYYSCATYGIEVTSLAAPSWACNPTLLPNYIIYNNEEIQSTLVNDAANWFKVMCESTTAATSILCIDSRNSEFIFNLTCSISSRYVDPIISKYLSIDWYARSKINRSYMIHEQSPGVFKDMNASFIEIIDGDIQDNGMELFTKLVSCFIKMITDPIDVFKRDFIESIKEQEITVISI